MEEKINQEIRSYTEAVFFGLSLRQLFCAGAACGIAIFLFFIFRDRLGLELTSWICILGAMPFAAAGFIRYNSMTAEQFFWTWIRSEILTPKRLLFRTRNLYREGR